MRDGWHIYKTLEEVPEQAIKDYDCCSDETKEYVKKALSFSRIYILAKEPFEYSFCLALVTKPLNTDGGKEYQYFQTISDHMKDSTFLIFDSGHEWNINAQANGINIWEIKQLEKVIHKCPNCGAYVDNLDDFESYLYASFCCKDCIGPIQEEIDNKPNGWWTH